MTLLKMRKKLPKNIIFKISQKFIFNKIYKVKLKKKGILNEY